jgi:SpoVK/Ycf46/Vps4 family AAA+-type ATPase
MKYPKLLFIATSNFPKAIDNAFLSRSDLILTINLPTPEACRSILVNTLEGLGDVFPKVKKLAHDAALERAIELCNGLDGRRIRKLVVSACTFNKEVALDPNRLSMNDIIRAIKHEKNQLEISKGVT